jgi:hypothetical protein
MTVDMQVDANCILAPILEAVPFLVGIACRNAFQIPAFIPRRIESFPKRPLSIKSSREHLVLEAFPPLSGKNDNPKGRSHFEFSGDGSVSTNL